MVKDRKKNVMRFDEIQETVVWDIKKYVFNHDISLSLLADDLGVDKARLSELKKKVNGIYSFPLSERLLSALVWRGIVDLKKIEKSLDPKDARKQQWLRNQRLIMLALEIEAKKGIDIEKHLLELRDGA